MSWQAYVDSSLCGSGMLDQAAIFNVEGNSVWATTPNFKVSPEEMQVIVGALKDTSEPKKVQMSGIKVQGNKYMVIRADDERVYGKKGKEGVIIVKTKQAILVAHHDEDTPSTNAANIVEGLAEYLKGAGY